jgi:nickel/cobalt transporter (NicO) family protein
MGSLTNMLQPGAAPAWLLLSSAILLGLLHGLEPGHSKTMMTAFIVAVRGTVGQAVTLGSAATVSHTAVVWIVALAGMHFGGRFNAETNEPYFQVASAVLIIVIAVLMLLRAWRAQQRARRAAHQHGDRHDAGHHTHVPCGVGSGSHQDAHEAAHADDIRRRFTSANVTTGQIVMFGLAGGLIPCSAAIAVLVLCLQVGQFWLGVALVLCFSAGLAITLIASGTIAALGIRQVSRRWSSIGEFARRAPYLSGIVMICVGIYVGWQGWMSFPAM